VPYNTYTYKKEQKIEEGSVKNEINKIFPIEEISQ